MVAIIGEVLKSTFITTIAMSAIIVITIASITVVPNGGTTEDMNVAMTGIMIATTGGGTIGADSPPASLTIA